MPVQGSSDPRTWQDSPLPVMQHSLEQACFPSLISSGLPIPCRELCNSDYLWNIPLPWTYEHMFRICARCTLLDYSKKTSCRESAETHGGYCFPGSWSPCFSRSETPFVYHPIACSPLQKVPRYPRWAAEVHYATSTQIHLRAPHELYSNCVLHYPV